MIKYRVLAVLMLSVTAADAEDKIDYFKNETVESCYSKPMSQAVQGCMEDLSNKKQTEYEREFNNFLNKIISSNSSFNNFADFHHSVLAAKKSWDDFIKNECMAIAQLDIKGSYAYQSDYSACLVKGYQQRIIYYKAYQL
ncbi:hypothetical protein VRB23_09515 [Erwinia aphidicola]|uniref:hypothetical protein n=1 Tax=Erwinia aphidicola TaxID=68334 RepID=UPI0030CD5059